MINKWRFVENGNDGNNHYQCLACKTIFESPITPITPITSYTGETYGQLYCGYCGIRWQEEYKWGYEDREYYHDNRPVEDEPKIYPHWQLQERTLWKESTGLFEPLIDDRSTDSKGWKIVEIIKGSALYAAGFLKYKRINYSPSDYIKHECKLSIFKADPLKNPYSHLPLYRYLDSYSREKHYLEEYRKQWGLKQHEPKKIRNWYIPKTATAVL